MSGTTKTLHSSNPNETAGFARILGKHLGAGDAILLYGSVGAGKTHFARALIQSLLEENEDVPSPTYTLVQSYPGPECAIWHVDLYRLTDTEEVVELGLVDAFCDSICLVEWPDRLHDFTPQNALSLEIVASSHDDTRKLSLSWSDAKWDKRIEQAIHAFAT